MCLVGLSGRICIISLGNRILGGIIRGLGISGIRRNGESNGEVEAGQKIDRDEKA
jgi:hypothetical protein